MTLLFAHDTKRSATGVVMVFTYREGDVAAALIKLGISADEVRNELQGNCPMHIKRTGREDANPSWSINVDSGVHHCFSCGYRGNLLTLVAEIREFTTPFGRLDLDQAKSWLTTHIEVDLDALVKQMEEAKQSYISLPRLVPMSEARLAVFSEPPAWALEARGISIDLSNRYGIKWKEPDVWILPIRDSETKKLLGWQEKGQNSRSFFNRPTGVAKSKTVFGVDAWEGPVMVVVESPLDAVKIGVCRNSTEGVAIYGASPSDSQITIMKQADKLIMAFDNPTVDPAGKKALSEFITTAKAQGIEFWAFNYGDSLAKDIGDLTPDEIRYGIENAVHCVKLVSLKGVLRGTLKKGNSSI